jgi:hypothetical protein
MVPRLPHVSTHAKSPAGTPDGLETKSHEGGDVVSEYRPEDAHTEWLRYLPDDQLQNLCESDLEDADAGELRALIKAVHHRRYLDARNAAEKVGSVSVFTGVWIVILALFAGAEDRRPVDKIGPWWDQALNLLIPAGLIAMVGAFGALLGWLFWQKFLRERQMIRWRRQREAARRNVE